MTIRHGVHTDALDQDGRAGRPASTPAATWPSRTWARIFAGRFDIRIESGVEVTADTPLAAHRARLTSRRERRALAATLTNVLRDAGLADGGDSTTRVPVRIDVVRASADLVHDVLARLAGPLPVRARGMARLRILLSDGRGPLYSTGPGTFAAAMRGVLAAL